MRRIMPGRGGSGIAGRQEVRPARRPGPGSGQRREQPRQERKRPVGLRKHHPHGFAPGRMGAERLAKTGVAVDVEDDIGLARVVGEVRRLRPVPPDEAPKALQRRVLRREGREEDDGPPCRCGSLRAHETPSRRDGATVASSTRKNCASPRSVSNGAGLGARHPHLRAEVEEDAEQSGAPGGVEVGGDFVEEDDRRVAGELRGETRMGEDDADEERLLLPRRALRGRRGLRAVDHDEVGEVRSGARPAGGAVGGSARGEVVADAVFGFGRRRCGEERLHRAVDGDRRGRERPVGRLGGDGPAEERDALASRRRDGDGDFAICASIAANQRASVRPSSNRRFRLRIARSWALTRSPCSGSSARTRRSRKRRRSEAAPVKRPSIAGVSQTTRQRSRSAWLEGRRRAVHADRALLFRPVGGERDPGPDFGLAVGPEKGRRDRPAAVAGMARDIGGFLARRRPRPGDRNDTASRRFVFPAPVRAVRTTGSGPRRSASGRVPETREFQRRQADFPEAAGRFRPSWRRLAIRN